MHGHLKFKKKIWIFQISIESAVLIIKNLINVNIKIQGLDGFVTRQLFFWVHIFSLFKWNFNLKSTASVSWI